tara:strand:- start:373 stop:1047 length:675 start_codon:yes stop_codon:yes gene_type:complete
MTKTAILIPARFNSSRFPGKPLTDLGGVPMIKRVYDRCKNTGYDTYVLTDSVEIERVIGKDTILDNSYHCNNGTERCAAAVKRSILLDEYTSFINVQGDMPDVTFDMIDKCIKGLQHYNISTVFTDMPSHLQNDPNSVKMVRAGDSALWFGRGMVGYGYWHIGVYGYKRHALEMYLTLPIELEEQVEELEQLRWLVAGWSISCLKTKFDGIEINTPQDAERWNG